MAQAQPVLAANNFLVPNATFFVELLAFVIILGILAKYVLPPVQKAMAVREATIKKQLEDAEAARKKLREAEEQYQRALTEARIEAAQIREHARAEAQRTVEEMRERAQEEAARIIARGEEQLALQRSAVVRELRAEVGTLAVELSERIIDERLADDAEVRATVDSFLAGLESQDRAKVGSQP